MWLNGPTQWEDHKIGKKSVKNILIVIGKTSVKHLSNHAKSLPPKEKLQCGRRSRAILITIIAIVTTVIIIITMTNIIISIAIRSHLGSSVRAS